MARHRRVHLAVEGRYRGLMIPIGDMLDPAVEIAGRKEGLSSVESDTMTYSHRWLPVASLAQAWLPCNQLVLICSFARLTCSVNALAKMATSPFATS